MTNNRKVGIWMDHASANIIEIIDNFIITKTIKSANSVKVENRIYDNDETHHQKKEIQQQSDYYKTLSAKIKGYDSVILFGPTDAKIELQNILEKDKQYNEIKICVISTDNMTEKQQIAFVSEYFSDDKK
jgi:hypothetical protein